MQKLIIFIELNGVSVHVGDIEGENSDNACFKYADSYLSNPESRAISISLPLSNGVFDAKTTKSYFEGLLPEGFTRKCVADWMHIDENNYLSILTGLGHECLGAIRVIDEGAFQVHPEYRKLDDIEVKKLAKEGATESAELVTKSHLSLTGASGKVGLYYDGINWFLPIGNAPSTHIVKQSHVRLNRIVCNELLCLNTAKKLGLDVVDNFIINLGEYEDDDILFATKRYDRKIDSSCKTIDDMYVPFRLHQEDFAQALGIASADKYEKNAEGYMRRAFELLRNYSSNPIEDQMKLWEICIFNYMIGNTDNHIKNLSLIYSSDLKNVRLSPAYDIVSTIIYDSSSEEMSMSVGGMYRIFDITRDCFEREARNIGLGTKLAMRRFDDLCASFPNALKAASRELKEQGLKGVEEICETILRKKGLY